MSVPFEIEQRRPEIESEVSAEGAELVELSFRHAGGRSVITLTVDRPGGITLDECARINQRVGRWMDELSAQYEPGTDFIKGSYSLEVNSPGLDRPLRSAKDFERASGQIVRVIWRDAAGRTYTTIGVVTVVTAGAVALMQPNKEPIQIPYDALVRATKEIGFRR